MSKSLPYHWKDYLQDVEQVDQGRGYLIHFKGAKWEFISQDNRRIIFIKTHDTKPLHTEIIESSPALRTIKKKDSRIWDELIYLLLSQDYEITLPLIEDLETELGKKCLSIGDLKSLSNRDFNSLFEADFYLEIAEDCNRHLESMRKRFNKLKKSCMDATSKQALLGEDIRHLFDKFEVFLHQYKKHAVDGSRKAAEALHKKLTGKNKIKPSLTARSHRLNFIREEVEFMVYQELRSAGFRANQAHKLIYRLNKILFPYFKYDTTLKAVEMRLCKRLK